MARKKNIDDYFWEDNADRRQLPNKSTDQKFKKTIAVVVQNKHKNECSDEDDAHAMRNLGPHLHTNVAF